jgi:hypothetical protein
MRRRPDGDHGDPQRSRPEEIIMLLATTTVADIEQFLKVFGTAGADKRALHGSKGSVVYRDPNENNRMWVVFDWDEQGWTDFVSDPEVPAVLKDAGHLSKPQVASVLGEYRA